MRQLLLTFGTIRRWLLHVLKSQNWICLCQLSWIRSFREVGQQILLPGRNGVCSWICFLREKSLYHLRSPSHHLLLAVGEDGWLEIFFFHPCCSTRLCISAVFSGSSYGPLLCVVWVLQAHWLSQWNPLSPFMLSFNAIILWSSLIVTTKHGFLQSYVLGGKEMA